RASDADRLLHEHGRGPRTPAADRRRRSRVPLNEEPDMDLSKLTLKSQTALESAREIAIASNHQAIEPVHVLLALLSDPEGVVYPLLHRLGISPRTLRDRAEEVLARIPKVYAQGAEVTLSPATRDLLEAAFREAEALTDEYVSTEHLFLAMLQGTG